MITLKKLPPRFINLLHPHTHHLIYHLSVEHQWVTAALHLFILLSAEEHSTSWQLIMASSFVPTDETWLTHHSVTAREPVFTHSSSLLFSVECVTFSWRSFRLQKTFRHSSETLCHMNNGLKMEPCAIIQCFIALNLVIFQQNPFICLNLRRLGSWQTKLVGLFFFFTFWCYLSWWNNFPTCFIVISFLLLLWDSQ